MKMKHTRNVRETRTKQKSSAQAFMYRVSFSVNFALHFGEKRALGRALHWR